LLQLQPIKILICRRLVFHSGFKNGGMSVQRLRSSWQLQPVKELRGQQPASGDDETPLFHMKTAK
jgi:hypothetical protein